MSLRIILISLSFWEGACVMATELFGAKLIAPFFGSSLYVWAGVLGVTMFALMLGYYVGGHISSKSKIETALFWVLFIAGCLLIIMPFSANLILSKTIFFDIKWGTVVSLLVFLFPPLFFMGMTSPLIIAILTKNASDSGKIAGSIYAISTFGGIISTFLVGFYLLPEYGIKLPAICFGFVLALPPFILLLFRKKFISILPFLFFTLISLSPSQFFNELNQAKLIYESEGILGQIKVVDLPYYSPQRGWCQGRALMVNNTVQTIANADNLEYDLWDASIYFPACVSNFSPQSDALLLGLGGGTILHQFKRLGFNVDVVEIDERIKEVAHDFFAVDRDENIIVDDARHYINTCKKKYDVITLDLFLNENPPSHVITLESFKLLSDMLNENGLVMMNFFGFISGMQGRAARCILKTFNEAGFITEIIATPGEEYERNLIFLAHKSKVNRKNISYFEPGLDTIKGIENLKLVPNENILTDAIVLTDEKPILEKIYLPASMIWRKSSIIQNILPRLENNFQ